MTIAAALRRLGTRVPRAAHPAWQASRRRVVQALDYARRVRAAHIGRRGAVTEALSRASRGEMSRALAWAFRAANAALQSAREGPEREEAQARRRALFAAYWVVDVATSVRRAQRHIQPVRAHPRKVGGEDQP